MAAITWRNMMGPALNAEVPMAAATQSMNAGFAGLNRALEQYQGRQKEAIDERTKANMDAYYAAGSQITDPEQFAQWQAGAGQQLLQGFGTEVDQGAIRSWNETRPGALMDRVKTNNEFGTYTREQNEAGIRDQVASLIASGDVAGARAIVDQQELLNEAPLYQAISAEDRAIEDRSRATLLEGRADEEYIYGKSRRELNDSRSDKKHDLDEESRLRTETLNRTLTDRIKTFEDSKTAQVQGIAQLGTTLGMPMGRDGLPDITNMTPEQLTQFNTALVESGLDASRTSTSVLEEAKKTLLAEGYTLGEINAATGAIDTFAASGTQLSTEDTEARERNIARIEKERTKAEDQNIFYSNPAKELEDQSGVLKRVDTEVKDGQMTKSALKEQISTWMNTGLQLQNEDGSWTTVKIPPKLINAAFDAGLESDTWISNATDKNMIAFIKDALQNPAYEEERQTAAYLSAGGAERDIESIRSQSTARSGVETPSDYVDNFFRQLQRRSQ